MCGRRECRNPAVVPQQLETWLQDSRGRIHPRRHRSDPDCNRWQIQAAPLQSDRRKSHRPGRTRPSQRNGDNGMSGTIKAGSEKATTRTGSETLDRALKIAESLLNEAEQTEIGEEWHVDRDVAINDLDKLTDELWKVGEEYETMKSDDRFGILSPIVADFLRGIADESDLRHALEDCDA